VGVDFSPCAAEALALARTLAATIGADVSPVYVIEDHSSAEWWDDAGVSTWLTRAGLSHDRLTVRFGLPWVELARQAHAVQPSLVIVGSHGRAGFQPLALGSTAARLALMCPAPVVVVNPRHRPIRVALDPVGADTATGPVSPMR
jgi:nucleotide-binding universal stress UspA family protein